MKTSGHDMLAAWAMKASKGEVDRLNSLLEEPVSVYLEGKIPPWGEPRWKIRDVCGIPATCWLREDEWRVLST